MGVKATAIGGWEEFTPPVKNNIDDSEPVTCRVRPIPDDIRANLAINSTGAADGKRGVQLDLSTQRAIMGRCCVDVTNYTGINGEPVTNGVELMLLGGAEGTAFVVQIVNKILALSWGPRTRGESKPRSDTSTQT